MSTPQLKNLETAFIDDCLKEFNKNKNTRELYFKHEFGFDTSEIKYFEIWEKEERLTTVLFFLSRTPDGQAVMPFLDVDTEWELFTSTPEIQYKKLDHFMYEQFTEALRVGKGFELALQQINQLYIDHFYV
jgi:hypothetical protein